jgi:dTDP-glucose 4,6-dehydratase
LNQASYNANKNERTIIRLIIDKLGKSEDLIQFVKDRPGHDKRYAMDISKIKRELGWNPEYCFEEGIEGTIEWYLANTKWVENCISGEYVKYYQQNYGERESGIICP